MGSVQQAVLGSDVLEFDASVRAPWRPPLEPRRGLRLVPAPAFDETPAPMAPPVLAGAPFPAGRPFPPRPARRGSGRAPVPAGAPARRPAAAPGGRPPVSGPPVARAVRGAGCATPGRPQAGSTRLTSRGRRLLAVLVLGGGVALASWITPLVTGGGGGDLRLTGAASVVVEQGDTLWSIAASVAGEDDDVRAVVDRIMQLNGLPGPALVPGQVLELP